MSIMGAKMYCMYVSDNTRKALEENLAQGKMCIRDRCLWIVAHTTLSFHKITDMTYIRS